METGTTGTLFGSLDRQREPVAENDDDSPLAERLRPRLLEEFVGQRHLVGAQRLVRRIVEGATPTSMILWGPPGVGKTTLARLMASTARRSFVELSATATGVRQVRAIADESRQQRRSGSGCVLLFLDEIHRFNKAQQDALLPYVESGDLILIGATTENPSFEVVPPLLSRCKVVQLHPLDQSDLMRVLRGALETEPPRGLQSVGVEIDDDKLALIAEFAAGDARVALSTLELAVLSKLQEGERTEVVAEKEEPAPEKTEATANASRTGSVADAGTNPAKAGAANQGASGKRFGGDDGDATPTSKGLRLQITTADLREAMQRRVLRHDKQGEEHFNLISALHKSVRNSDPHAGLYWLARLLEAGEDPLYVGRRLVRMASEDIGLADPAALGVAIEGFRATQMLGMPEADICLAQVTVYLATAPKSNAVYTGYRAAAEAVEKTHNLPVPLQLRNAATPLLRRLGWGKDYEYAHEHPSGVTAMETMPDPLRDREFFRPGGRGFEDEIGRRMREWENIKRRLRSERANPDRTSRSPA